MKPFAMAERACWTSAIWLPPLETKGARLPLSC